MTFDEARVSRSAASATLLLSASRGTRCGEVGRLCGVAHWVDLLAVADLCAERVVRQGELGITGLAAEEALLRISRWTWAEGPNPYQRDALAAAYEAESVLAPVWLVCALDTAACADALVDGPSRVFEALALSLALDDRRAELKAAWALGGADGLSVAMVGAPMSAAFSLGCAGAWQRRHRILSGLPADPFVRAAP